MNDALETLDSLSHNGYSALGDGRRTLAVIFFSLLFHLVLVLLLSLLWHDWQQRLEKQSHSHTVTVELNQPQTLTTQAKPKAPKLPIIPKIHQPRKAAQPHPKSAPKPQPKPQVKPEPQPKQVHQPKPKPKPQTQPQHQPKMPPLPMDNANTVDLKGNVLHGPDTKQPIKGVQHPKKIVLPGQKRQVLHPQPHKQTQAGKAAKKQATPAKQVGKAAGTGHHPQAAKRGSPNVSSNKSRHAEQPSHTRSVTSTRGHAASVVSAHKKAQKSEPKKNTGTQGKLGSLLSAPPESGGNGPPIPDKALEHLKGMQALNDNSMKKVVIGEPFSEIEARRIRMMNLFLRRMEKQIRDHWHVPSNSSPSESGVIDIKLDPQGYLEEAYVDLPSGNVLLDESALDAVRSVIRFKVPDSPQVAEEYYHVLRFSYRGGTKGKDK